MNLKNSLKALKMNESAISMVLGALVIVVVGVLLLNYFGGDESVERIGDGSTVDEDALPAQYVVESGDDLWNISEKFYGTGYNWVDIATENQIADPGLITEGQVLSIPDVTPKSIGVQLEEETPDPTPTVLAEETERETEQVVEQERTVGETYTVARGDSLWKIAESVYGDGYRWVDIARANDLVNPDIIHAGNVFVLPR